MKEGDSAATLLLLLLFFVFKKPPLLFFIFMGLDGACYLLTFFFSFFIFTIFLFSPHPSVPRGLSDFKIGFSWETSANQSLQTICPPPKNLLIRVWNVVNEKQVGRISGANTAGSGS